MNSTLSTEQPLVATMEKSNTSSQLLKGGSPFRLLEGYASEDNSEKEAETCVVNEGVSSNLENASSLYKTEKRFGPLSLSNMPCAVASSEVVEGTGTTSIINGNEHNGNKHVQQVSISHASSLEVLQKENVMSSNEHSQDKENETRGSTQHKIDKFGRLVKNGASDSDSDDSHRIGRRRRGRTRSRSQSFSPTDRRRRSPLKRREKRSRSRSWSPRKWRSRSRSPRNRRSRSRSPRFRRAGGFSSENKRRVKGQMPDCFDFRRGRCYRGASCRYLHHGSGKSDESRRQRSKEQDLEFPRSSRTNVSEEIKQISEKEAVHEHDRVRGPEVKLYNNFVASRDINMDQKRQYSFGEDAHNRDSQSTQYHMVKSENSRDIPPSLLEAHSVDIEQEGPNPVASKKCQETAESHQPSILDASSIGNMDTLKSCDNASQKMPNSCKNSVDQKSLSSPLDPVCQNADFLPQQSDNSSISNYSPHRTSTSLPNRLPERSSNQNTKDLHNHPSHIPLHSLPHSQGLDNVQMKQQQTASSVFQSSGESFPSSMLPNQSSFFALQPNPSLASLPPPPSVPLQDSTVNAEIATPSVSSHFRQSHLPLRTNFGSQIVPRPYPTELLAQSQSNGFQQRPCLQIHDANQPVLHASLPVYNLPVQQCGGPSMSRDDGFTQPPVQNVIASNSFAQGNSQPHTMPFSHQMLGNKMQPFPGESFPISGGDQYDPLFDSIEPFSRLSRKFDYTKKMEVTGDSDMLLGISGSNKPLDMEENNKRKDGEAVPSAASADNEEFGETADVEVGAVENESPSKPVEINMATGETEIDQIKSPGKSKKDKDSRSMKLFKVALADFVKEVLKPSWQQGNMSKEAFKTIVKKTVDKVSGAMKSHQIPKSRAKIDQYIESSQRKLTKLVMGYVDKYVNV